MVKTQGLWNYIEWIASGTLLVGIALTAWNIYPLNLFVNIAGNFLWLAMALYWGRLPLLLLQIFVIILYFTGIFKYIMTIL